MRLIDRKKQPLFKIKGTEPVKDHTSVSARADNRPETLQMKKLLELSKERSNAKSISHYTQNLENTRPVQLQNIANASPVHKKRVSPVFSQQKVVQRVVEPVKMGGTIYWRTSWDNKNVFATKTDAENHETNLKSSFAFNLNPVNKRSPTFFTMMQTDKDNTIGDGGSNQGPHTIGEVGINKGITDMKKGDIDTMFSEHIPTPLQALQFLDDEKNELTTDPQFSAKRLRFKERYEDLYNTYSTVPSNKIPIKKKIFKQIFNLSPYGTYAWNRKNPQSLANWKKLIGGKGEKANATIKKLTDPNADSFFKSTGKYRVWKKKRQQFLKNRK